MESRDGPGGGFLPSWRLKTSGIIAPDNETRMRLVAASAPPGLETVAPPSLNSIANNHRSYAIQWFLFAGIATLIYGLALRIRWKKEQKA